MSACGAPDPATSAAALSASARRAASAHARALEPGGRPRLASISDGVSRSAWLATKEEFGNFELQREDNIPENGNSGVFIRAPKNGAPWVAGLEIQVLDDYGSKWKGLKPAQFTGSIYAVQAPSQRATKKAGEWQTMRIRCNGGQCCVWINGQCIIDVSLKKLAPKAKNVTGLKRTQGFIGLQNHASPVHFRNIQIKRLK